MLTTQYDSLGGASSPTVNSIHYTERQVRFKHRCIGRGVRGAQNTRNKAVYTTTLFAYRGNNFQLKFSLSDEHTNKQTEHISNQQSIDLNRAVKQPTFHIKQARAETDEVLTRQFINILFVVNIFIMALFNGAFSLIALSYCRVDNFHKAL